MEANQANPQQGEDLVLNFNQLREGDVLQGTNGNTTVLKVYEEHLPKTMYRLEFEGGKIIEASGNHLWYIETDLDRSLHRKRIKDAKKLFKKTSAETIEDLLDIAAKDEVVETRLIDILDLFGASSGQGEMAKAIKRVASSIGHIAEENTIFQDMSTGETEDGISVRIYDARLFAQQILALHDRKFRKKWPLILGSVVTTAELSRIALSVDIPEISPKIPRA